MRLALLLFDVEPRENATESGALCELHSPELSQFFHTHRQPVDRSEGEVGKLRVGSLPAEKDREGDLISLFLPEPANLLNHGRRS